MTAHTLASVQITHLMVHGQCSCGARVTAFRYQRCILDAWRTHKALATQTVTRRPAARPAAVLQFTRWRATSGGELR